MKSYEKSVWSLAVSNAEGDVMRVTPTLVGGKRPNESVEQYAARGRKIQDEALEQLEFARKRLKAVTEA